MSPAFILYRIISTRNPFITYSFRTEDSHIILQYAVYTVLRYTVISVGDSVC